MTINERVRYIRKEYLGMNQTEFADLIGMKQTGVSSMEIPGGSVTDRAIKSICYCVTGLREEWLRDGIEPMFIEPDTFSLDEFMKARGATDLESRIIRAYFELDPEDRKRLLDHFADRLLDSPEAKRYADEHRTSQFTDELTVEEAEAIYKNSLSTAPGAEHSASNTTAERKEA